MALQVCGGVLGFYLLFPAIFIASVVFEPRLRRVRYTAYSASDLSLDEAGRYVPAFRRACCQPRNLRGCGARRFLCQRRPSNRLGTCRRCRTIQGTCCCACSAIEPGTTLPWWHLSCPFRPVRRKIPKHEVR